MSLEEYIPDLDSSEGLGNSADQAPEKVSEAFKEAVRKGSAGIGRTKKDEKKAKKYDFLLASFLVKIIVDKKYDSLLNAIFKTIDTGYSSNFIIGILSLINIEVSNKIREISRKEKVIFNFKENENTEFDDQKIDKEVKNRINFWIEDIIDSSTMEFSNLKTKKNINLLETKEKEIINFTAQVFTFFLHNINISISKAKSINISEFIISELKKAIGKLNIEEV